MRQRPRAAGTKLAFVALLIVILATGSETTQLLTVLTRGVRSAAG